MKPLTPERKQLLAHLLVDPRYDVEHDMAITAMLPDPGSMQVIVLTHAEVNHISRALVPKAIDVAALLRDERLMLFVGHAPGDTLKDLPWT